MTTTAAKSNSSAPIRHIGLGRCQVEMEKRADGCLIVRNTAKVSAWPEKLTQRLDHWAQTAPDRLWLAERDASGGWRKLTYADARKQIRAIASALLTRNLSADRPIVILSGNSIDHALLGMAAMYAGIAYAPVSPAYSLVSSDHGKLKYIFDLLTPGMVFADDGAPYARAIANAVPADAELVVARNAPDGRPATTFASLLQTAENAAAVDAANAKVGPETIAKFLFTSGSTGMPKGVVNTQLMLCANMAMATDHFAFMRETPPVTLDWSPWNHTAGGNHDFNIFLYNGGTFYIDDGKPTPAGIEATIRNLRDVSPTWYFNVPKGYDAMLPYLHADKELAKTFVKDLRMFWYAGAGMAQHVWDGLDELAVSTTGERILVLTGLGSTETAPFAMGANETMVGQGNIGVPAQGCELKLVPADGKWEARFRGPHITPGYWRQPELTEKAFDEEGYYLIGDALRFVDPDDAGKGFYFDGRVAENFKLATGTWVATGPMRAGFIDHCAPYVQDAVLTGADCEYIGALVFPDVAACARLMGKESATMAEIAASPKVRAALQEKLASLAANSTGSSTRIARAVILDSPPDIDRSEMTDKGSINQRAVLGNRDAAVKRLYTDPAPEDIIIAG
ncbi:MAG: feruloyl-CoA synthase [Beijerinckiaceae bacterium]